MASEAFYRGTKYTKTHNYSILCRPCFDMSVITWFFSTQRGEWQREKKTLEYVTLNHNRLASAMARPSDVRTTRWIISLSHALDHVCSYHNMTQKKNKGVSKRRHTHLLQMAHKVPACSSHGAWYSVIKINLRLHLLTQCQSFRVLLENNEEVSCNNTTLVICYNGKTSRCCFTWLEIMFYWMMNCWQLATGHAWS